MQTSDMQDPNEVCRYVYLRILPTREYMIIHGYQNSSTTELLFECGQITYPKGWRLSQQRLCLM